jgi:hypothetical protein
MLKISWKSSKKWLDKNFSKIVLFYKKDIWKYLRIKNPALSKQKIRAFDIPIRKTPICNLV